MVGWYHIYKKYFITYVIAAAIFPCRLVPYLRNIFEVVLTNYPYVFFLGGWVSRTQINIPSADRRVDPLSQPFVHVGGTRSAMNID